MLFRVLLFLFLLGSLGAATPNNDPSEEFVAAYRSFKEAERLDQAGRKEEAITKYRYAENHLIDISNNYPNWQKPIVEYRLSKIRNNLARITSSSNSNAAPAYSNAVRSSNDNERPAAPLASSENNSELPRSSDEGRRQEPRYSETTHENFRNGSESPSTEEPPATHSMTSDSEGIESAPSTTSQAVTKRNTDIPTLSIIPPASRNASSKELLQLQKELKRTEAELEKAHNDILDKASELDQSKVSLVEARAQLARAEQQLVDVKNDLKKNRAGSLQREAALKKQLEEKVTALLADKEVILEENNQLQQHLKQATNSLAQAVSNKDRLEQLQIEVNNEKSAAAALHEQLTAAQRERDEAHAESTTLTQQVKQVSDSLAVAEKKGRDLEAFQTQAASLQQQLQQANNALAAAQQKNIEMDALKVHLAALTSEGASKNKMVADLQEANKKLQISQKKLSDDFQKRLATAEADQEVLNEERTSMETRLKQATAQIAALQRSGADTTRLQQQVKELTQELEKNTKQLSEAQASQMETETIQKQALVDLEEKLRVAVMERQNMETKKGELEQQLNATNEKIKSLIAKSTPDVAALQTTLQQSQTELQAVKNQLEASEKKIALLEKSGPEQNQFLQEKEKELAAAREQAGKFQKELLTTQQQLSSIQQEIKTKDDRYNELKKQWDQKNEEMAALQKKGASEGQEKVIAENELLKGIVLRELKAEARRQQLRKLIVEDLDKLKVKSDTLSLQLRKLARPVKLTPEERALFKDKLPLSPEGELDDDKLIVAVEASKNEKKLAPSNVPLVPQGTNAVTGTTPAPGTNSVTGTNAPTEIKKEEGKEAKKETAIDQEKYRAAIKKAKEQFEHQNYAEAEKSFREALNASPNDYITLSNLGVVEFQLGKMSDAESILKKACEQDPKKSFAFTTLGIVNYRQERFDDAEKVLRQAVAINDQDFTAHNYLGIVLAAAGKSKAGENEIMKSIQINPNYADAHFNLAVIYATGKPPAKKMAKDHYQKAISLGAPVDATLEKLIN